MTETCDFTSNGLKETDKNKIETIKWNIGSVLTFQQYAMDMYTQERRATGSSANSSVYVWDGKIGFIYPSDYMLSSGAACSLDSATKKISNASDNNDFRTCVNYSWIFYNKNLLYQWTITPLYYNAKRGVLGVNNAGYVYSYGDPHYYLATLPTLYLKSNVKTIGGNGSQSSPYILD